MAIRKIPAEIAGLVSEVVVKIGDAVAAEDTLIMIECMKMLLPVATPWKGIVRAIHVDTGDAVQEGQVLVELEG